MSEEGQIYRTLAQKGIDMRFPCFQVTIPKINDLEKLAKLYYNVADTVKKIASKFGIEIRVNLVDRYNIECNKSPTGSHEITELKSDDDYALICIHCGQLEYKTRRSHEEILKYMRDRKFKRQNLMPIASEEELPF